MAVYRLLLNPISGTKSKQKRRLEMDLRQILKKHGHELESRKTYYHAHATELAREAVDDGVDVLIVAGGDGTINEVLEPLRGSVTSLAIIPMGSGNGIARSLGISMNFKKALEICTEGKARQIDLGVFGKHYFLGVAGVGFDAHIARCFQEESSRGLWKYAWLILRECIRYQPTSIKLSSSSGEISQPAFIFTAANANQYGNNAYIDKAASMSDGLLNLVHLRPFSNWLFPLIIWKGLRGEIVESKYTESFLASSAILETNSDIAHVDGEPIEITSPVSIRLEAGAIAIILPNL